MSITIEKNEMGGKSVFVGSEADLAKVPKTHQHLVGSKERSALADPARYFSDLAGRAKRPLLARWLKILADCESYLLELHTASIPGFPAAAYFRFVLGNDFVPGVRLRSAKTGPSLPLALAEVYELIDGINHFGYGEAGELSSAGEIAPLTQAGFWLSETNKVNPETCQAFYSTLNGDILCCQPPNDAVWYLHEVGELRPAGSLRSLVDQYFQNMIQGEVLERE